MNTFPKAALAQHIAVLGKTGSGKSYAVRGIVEGLLDDSARVCIVDPTGTWNGLRSSATGKSGGYPVIIFGGSHADMPLSGQHGEAIAEVIGTSSTPAIIDTSLMRVGERTRFFADFADALVRKNKGPLHLIIDEAHLFAPQGKVNDPQSGAMLHAANNLVSLGRSRGLRIVLITQRPAKLHKDSLTQVETLVAMRLIAPQDRKAVEEWIKDNADEAKGKEIIASLAALKTGQGWVWAPELGILDRISFPKIKTFDSGRAPDGSEATGQVLAPIDREAIAQKLKVVAADAVANDPALLKRRIAELERQARTAPVAAATSPGELYAAEKRGRDDGFAAGLLTGHEQGWRDCENAHNAARSTVIYDAPERPATQISPRPPRVSAALGKLPAQVQRPAPRSSAKSNGSGVRLPPGEKAVLSACIQFPDGLERSQLTVLTGYKRSSRDAYIARLREKGYILVDGEMVRATDEGAAALPDAEPLPTGAALRDYWMARLPPGERAILEVLISHYPVDIARSALDEHTEYKRSSRDAYLARLAAKQLVTEPERGTVRATDTLFQ